MKILTVPALACAVTLGFGLACAQTITPSRVGPVSQYGQLLTGKNSSGKGQIYGSCEGVKDGKEVQVRGMSLYWSLMPQAVEYWNAEGVSSMVKDMKIQIVRAAMATGNEDWSNGYKGYGSDPNTQKNLMNAVVQAAIENDIYVIIDWHSHNAHEQTESSKQFFAEMAQKWGQYDNVIFEVYNEPQQIDWSLIKNYANQVVAEIRKYSDNLVLVGTPSWDQKTNVAIGSEVTGENVAYTMHFYANSHCWEGTYGWGDGTTDACEGTNALKAMNAGLSVFVSEWGTADLNGDGDPDTGRNTSWQNYLNQHKLSWANWSASHISEGTAAFSGSSNKNSLQYTTSGNLVKGYLATNPESYTKCSDGSQGGDNGGSQGGDNGGNNGGNQGGQQAVFNLDVSSLNVSFGNKVLNIAGVGSATVELFDMKGNKLLMVDGVAGSLSLASFPAGVYMAKVTSGSASKMQKINLK